MRLTLRKALIVLALLPWGTHAPWPGLRADPPRLDTSRLSSGGFALRFSGTPLLRPAGPDDPTRHRNAAPASSGSAAEIGPNLRLGDDPPALPASRRAQAEPHLARSMTDTNLVVATFQEGRFADGGAVNCGYAISRDGGASWSRGLIPHLIRALDDGPFDRASDPVAGVDLSGTIYLNTLAIRQTTAGLHTTLVLTRSRDGGQSFSKPLTVVTSATDAVFPDKNWMAVNTFARTATANRIAVTYTSFETTDTVQISPIKVTWSDDEGGSWSAPKAISPDSCQGSQPVFLPDGSLAVVYFNFSSPVGNRLEIAHSPDGGTTFAPPQPIATVRLYDDPVARDGSFLPSATADRTLGLVYVTYQELRSGNRPSIMFTRSSDRGKSWTTPITINDTPNNRSVFNPAIAVSPDGQHVTVAFCDKRHDDGSGRWVNLYVTQSFDGGATWAPNLRVSEISSDLNLAPLTPAGRMLGDYHGLVPALDLRAPGLAIWVDTRTSNPDPFVSTVARARGSTFEAWRRLAFTTAELADLLVSGAAADLDGDGWPNLFEYASGLSPHVAESNPVRASVGSGMFTVEFEAMRSAEDVRWVWHESADLVRWIPVEPASFGELVPASEVARARLRFGFGASDPRLFVVPGAALE